MDLKKRFALKLLYNPAEKLPGILEVLRPHVWPKAETDPSVYRLVQRCISERHIPTWDRVAQLLDDVDSRLSSSGSESAFGRMVSVALEGRPALGPIREPEALELYEHLLSLGELVGTEQLARSQLYEALLGAGIVGPPHDWFLRLLRLLLYQGRRREALSLDEALWPRLVSGRQVVCEKVKMRRALLVSTLQSQTTILGGSHASGSDLRILTPSIEAVPAMAVARLATILARRRARRLLLLRKRSSWRPAASRQDREASDGRDTLRGWMEKARERGLPVEVPSTWDVTRFREAVKGLEEEAPLAAMRLYEAAAYVLPDILRSGASEKRTLLEALLISPLNTFRFQLDAGYEAVCVRSVAMALLLHAGGPEPVPSLVENLKALAVARGQLVEMAWAEDLQTIHSKVG